ncbi:MULTISPECIES: helix-turn-helix domain-containing protein [unclassified Thermosynechococcus]|uniref:helix-turn-helix domain-containing protein n=1 Tax=unclassified Thermosynechococcus TaxID=2622553 RepID=UPI002106741F|nr:MULTISPECIES: helix-turn-helix domain-containing protein [unclassified Thermosynechococcus]WKT84485.1 helix-turn-helix domain-containing protein [Thermosynechococcus sp. HY596]WNC63618.1 helix-turn-helix domain-containing protein [Thermosynechococcus sp. HY591]WNC66179.1 helix-turn-helix domain-containing protein [Thermosynechococcus sp. HY593]
MCRQVWNDALRERKDWIASRKCPVNACSVRSEYIIPADAPYPSFNVQCQRLTQAKQTNPDLASVNTQALQQVLKRVVGVDVGLEYFLSTSDGLQLARPKFFVEML